MGIPTVQYTFVTDGQSTSQIANTLHALLLPAHVEPAHEIVLSLRWWRTSMGKNASCASFQQKRRAADGESHVRHKWCTCVKERGRGRNELVDSGGMAMDEVPVLRVPSPESAETKWEGEGEGGGE